MIKIPEKKGEERRGGGGGVEKRSKSVDSRVWIPMIKIFEIKVSNKLLKFT